MSPRRPTARARRSAPFVVRSTPRVPLLDSTPFMMQVRCGPHDEIRQALKNLLFPPPKKERFSKVRAWVASILNKGSLTHGRP